MYLELMGFQPNFRETLLKQINGLFLIILLQKGGRETFGRPKQN